MGWLGLWAWEYLARHILNLYQTYHQIYQWGSEIIAVFFFFDTPHAQRREIGTFKVGQSKGELLFPTRFPLLKSRILLQNFCKDSAKLTLIEIYGRNILGNMRRNLIKQAFIVGGVRLRYG